jgi:hypothetical protein
MEENDKNFKDLNPVGIFPSVPLECRISSYQILYNPMDGFLHRSFRGKNMSSNLLETLL